MSQIIASASSHFCHNFELSPTLPDRQSQARSIHRQLVLALRPGVKERAWLLRSRRIRFLFLGPSETHDKQIAHAADNTQFDLREQRGLNLARISRENHRKKGGVLDGEVQNQPSATKGEGGAGPTHCDWVHADPGLLVGGVRLERRAEVKDRVRASRTISSGETWPTFASRFRKNNLQMSATWALIATLMPAHHTSRFRDPKRPSSIF